MNFAQAQANWESTWVDGPPDEDDLNELSDKQLLDIINNEPDWEDMSKSQARRISAQWEENTRRAKAILRDRSMYR